MRNIILDTDLGSDCDDAGALAVLHNLASKDKVEILAVTHCASEISGAVTVKAINEWYNKADIPVGRYDKSIFLEGGIYVRYTKPIAEKYLNTHKMPEFESSVRVMRKALAENTDVTIVIIGMMNNIALLLKSEPDDISPLDGAELVKKSVKNMYAMGGNFADLTDAEWNIKSDIESAKYVSQNFPVPIIYCGFEVGENVYTGESLKSEPIENPVKLAYSLYPGCRNGLRNSWDPITVYCAVEQETPFYRKSENMGISFDDTGRGVLEKDGKDCYLIANATNEEVRKELEKYIV